jgi:hypothetical protein
MVYIDKAQLGEEDGITLGWTLKAHPSFRYRDDMKEALHKMMGDEFKGVEQPGKDPRANESGSKGCGKIARGASARAARHIHPIPTKQYDGVASSLSPTRADSSLEHADRGSVLKRERMSYAEAARGKLP